MSKRDIEAVYPLSPVQQGMLFHSVYAPHSGVYVEQLSCTLHGELDIAAFEGAWCQAMARHAVLRTAFVWKRLDRMLQAVQRQVPLPLEQQDWRSLPPEEQEARLQTYLEADRRAGFDLSKAPLLRLTLFRTADAVHRLVWTHHHLLLDGWSLPLLLREVFAFYEARRQGRELDLPLPRPYADYIAWLKARDGAQAEAYWRSALAGMRAPTPLVVERMAAAGAEGPAKCSELRRRLSVQASEALQSLARRQQVTLSTVVQGAWALVLSRYSGEEDVAFGVTVSGRPADLPGAETMVGLFINTLPLRVHVPPQGRVGAWLTALQAQQAGLHQWEHTPLVDIQGWSEVPRGQPLFESIVVFENYPAGDLVAGRGSLGICDVRTIEQTNYPLTVVAAPGSGLELRISYDCGRFASGTVERMLGHLETVLVAIAAGSEQPLATLPMLTAAERQALDGWNDTAVDYGDVRCFHQLFEEHAARTPGAVALAFERQQLSYGELNRRANQLAHHLLRRGLAREALVAICLDNSPEMIVAVLAVLKAGGAYLPLDASYPPERLAFMLGDAQAAFLLTQAALRPALPDAGAEAICLDADWPAIAREPAEDPGVAVGPGDLVYAIYTSGSTGRPKGTLVEQRGLANLAHALVDMFATGPGSRVLQFASFSFDASVADIAMALAGGATLCLAPREVLHSVPDLLALLRDQAITTVTLPPAVLKLLPDEDLPALRTVASAGEACTWDVWARWAPGRRFLNGYGPTENTVSASFGQVGERIAEAATVPIGSPIANVQLHVLDRHLQPAPVGVPGELYIGGAGLARGYLNRPELTAERFVERPATVPPSGGDGRTVGADSLSPPVGRTVGGHPVGGGGRLYRTGDLVRRLDDGTLEFLGRIDDQVKVRGFRVELGEVEAALAQHPALQQAAVIAREGEAGVMQLVAYVVPAGDALPTPGELRGYLRRSLPDHMLPAACVTLPALPLTPSGKVDRRALPAPDQASRGVDGAAAPSTPTEELIAGIWAQVLGREQVARHDDFFALGGHSLLATQLISRLREAFGVELPLRSLFDAPAVADLARAVEAARTPEGEALPPLEPGPREGVLPLSFAQQRLWFLDQLEPARPFYNLPTAVRLRGALSVAALERSLNEIVRRHEALRTRFAATGGHPTQVIAPSLTIDLPQADLSALGEPARGAEVRRLAAEEARLPFDLAQGPLVRARLLRLGPEEHVALLTLHHIVADGWSMGVLVGELAVLYQAFVAGEPSSLPELGVQYADYARWQRAWLRGEALERQLAYWKRQLAGSPPLLELPIDHPRPAVQSSRGATHAFTLERDLAEQLTALSRREGVTLFMTLLASFQALLARYTGQEDICIGTPIANRRRPELEGLIGFFVNTLVLRTDLSGDPTFRELLKRVRQVALDAYAHQDLPFEQLVEAVQPERDLSHTPLFQAMLVLNNAPLQPAHLSGLAIEPLPVESGIARFDLTLQLNEAAEGLAGFLEYNAEVLESESIARLLGHWRTLLAGACADPEQPLSALPLLTRPEQQQLLGDWAGQAADWPLDRCAHQLFEEQAARIPEAIALACDEQQMSYAELDRRANQLAHALQRLGVGPEALVGLCVERSPEMVVGILGVLKAGGAYLPLDPHYPAERLAFMFDDAHVSVLLTQAHLAGRLPPHGAHVIQLDAEWPAIAAEPDTVPPTAVTPGNLAYVIYTSGSTGRPKGTLLCHRGLCNLALAQAQAFGVRQGKRVLQFAPLSFDASVWELVMALCNGATLCLAAPEALASGHDLARLLQAQAITHVTLPPSVLGAMPPAELPNLEVLVAAGEACPRELVARWAPGRRFFDAYGPTETTVCAAMAECEADDQQSPPIGQALPNTWLYVLDAHRQPVPIGVPGELHVAGVGLARGYLNRPELTAERFVQVRPPTPPTVPPTGGG
ncbi:MAG TPA: amino acid adenylation domain-containing protein [Anaerolineae bacterium]|nr:amino acid adenylation domain-containing protein [Anaerolineae bacterium]HPL28750.1 amino acid adenylation domain-containing protein [Anaerolineae bacterium]